MADLVIRDLPDDLAERLAQCAALSGRSIEAEAIAALSSLPATRQTVRSNEPFGNALSSRMAAIGITNEDCEALERSLDAIRSSRSDSIHRWIDFSDPEFGA